MLADLLRRLGAPIHPAPLSLQDGQLAMAALMVRISRVDGSYSAVERARIEAMLRARYGFGAGQAEELRLDAERAEAAAHDTVQFTRLIKDAVPYEERIGVVEALWQVAAADGINSDEHSSMRLIANLLGVADQDSALARQRALRAAS